MSEILASIKNNIEYLMIVSSLLLFCFLYYIKNSNFLQRHYKNKEKEPYLFSSESNFHWGVFLLLALSGILSIDVYIAVMKDYIANNQSDTSIGMIFSLTFAFWFLEVWLPSLFKFAEAIPDSRSDLEKTQKRKQ